MRYERGSPRRFELRRSPIRPESLKSRLTSIDHCELRKNTDGSEFSVDIPWHAAQALHSVA